MSHRNTRSTRLAAHALETRAVPAVVVDSTETYRSLTFTLQGTVETITTTGTGEAATTNTYDGDIIAIGTVDYTSATEGTSNTVEVTGSGRGVTSAGGYTNTIEGTLEFADTNGGWTITTPFAGTETWTSGRGSTTEALAPFTGSGTFNPSDYTFHAVWDKNDTETETTQHGEVNATVDQGDTPETDLSITSATATAGDAGTINLHVTAKVTGQLMQAGSETDAATKIIGTWESEDQSQDAEFEVPIAWNADRITADITGLEAPEWATRLVLKVDADNTITESNENNNLRDVDVQSVLYPPIPVDPTPVPPVPAVPSNYQIADDGTNHILYLDSQGNTIFRVPTFESFTGPISIGAGDINGDSVADPVVAAGVGGGPRVLVFDGMTGQTLADLMAFEEDFRGGVNLSVTDVTGDHKADVITGAGEGGAPRVRIFDVANGRVVQDFFAYEDTFRGGVTVASTDLNGDGVAEVVTGAGTGGSPLIHVFSGTTGGLLQSLFAADSEARNGVKVGAKLNDDNAVWITADTGTPEGVKDYRPGVPSAGESFLVLVPGQNWFDVNPVPIPVAEGDPEPVGDPVPSVPVS